MNNKGFAITTILYGILILFMMLLVSMLGMLSTYKDRLSILIENTNGTRDIINGEIRCSIEYDLNGGTGEISSQSDLCGSKITITDIKPNKDEYIFSGWSIKSSANVADYNSSDEIELFDNTTLYAIWEPEIVYLYKNGEEFEEATGGWQVVYHKPYYGEADVTKYDTSVTISSTVNTTYAALLTINKMDLSKYKCLYINVIDRTSDGIYQYNTIGLYNWDNNLSHETYSRPTALGLTANTPGLVYLDISTFNEKYYIGVGAGNENSGTSIISFDEIYLDRKTCQERK